MGAQARELRRNDLRGEVRVVVGLHAHLSAGQAGTDEFGDAFGVHGIGFMAFEFIARS